MKGGLRVNVQFWESIGASLFVLSVIREGYKIPFYYTPTSVFLPNNKSALHNADFVLGAITELLRVGSVVQCPCPPVVVVEEIFCYVLRYSLSYISCHSRWYIFLHT